MLLPRCGFLSIKVFTILYAIFFFYKDYACVPFLYIFLIDSKNIWHPAFKAGWQRCCCCHGDGLFSLLALQFISSLSYTLPFWSVCLVLISLSYIVSASDSSHVPPKPFRHAWGRARLAHLCVLPHMFTNICDKRGWKTEENNNRKLAPIYSCWQELSLSVPSLPVSAPPPSVGGAAALC